MALQHPDYKILSWSPEDMDGLSESAKCLGAPLTESESLYETLQRTYTLVMLTENHKQCS